MAEGQMNMMSDVNFYRIQAAEAASQAEDATSRSVQERCEGFAIWWSALADACEAGDLGRVHSLAINVACLKSFDRRGASPRLVH